MKNITKIATTTICSVPVIIGLVLRDYADDLQISQAGLAIIGHAENCKNQPYYCPANILTVGVGSTVGPIEPRLYDDQEIAQRWVADIKTAQTCVNAYAAGKHLPQSVFDATVSITFNVGCSKMKNSTMYHYLNTGEYQQACNELPRWNKSAGKILPGLVIRREKERNLCLTDLK